MNTDSALGSKAGISHSLWMLLKRPWASTRYISIFFFSLMTPSLLLQMHIHYVIVLYIKTNGLKALTAAVISFTHWNNLTYGRNGVISEKATAAPPPQNYPKPNYPTNCCYLPVSSKGNFLSWCQINVHKPPQHPTLVWLMLMHN